MSTDTHNSMNLDFYFDFGSPTAYLAFQRLRQLGTRYPLQVNYLPILLGGIFKATGNTSPVAIPAKGAYMLQHDLPRFAQRYGVPLNFNPHFPINTLNLMRAAIAAQQLECFERFAAAVYEAVWVEGKDMGDAAIVAEVLRQQGVNAQTLLELAQSPDIKAALIANTEEAVARGVFGAPTFFLGDEMFFGQDRLDFIEAALTA